MNVIFVMNCYIGKRQAQSPLSFHSGAALRQLRFHFNTILFALGTHRDFPNPILSLVNYKQLCKF